jgi:hypothetical protein
MTRYHAGRYLLALLLFAAGCAAPEPSPVPTPMPESVSDPAPDVTIVVGSGLIDTGPTPVADPTGYDIDPLGVLLAAVIILTGDVESAVAAGLVRPIEVDVALLAISSGVLDDWSAFLQHDDAPAQVRPAMRAHSSRKPTVRWNS